MVLVGLGAFKRVAIKKFMFDCLIVVEITRACFVLVYTMLESYVYLPLLRGFTEVSSSQLPAPFEGLYSSSHLATLFEGLHRMCSASSSQRATWLRNMSLHQYHGNIPCVGKPFQDTCSVDQLMEDLIDTR